ncbi:TetR/AcrR family transcriptional regulator [Nocardioides speluncae]|uniref:TetR/AcrR family transcriptional regulator n=1 Tax=Nocardioides speluncae TaxID=2670337 RepID=UPI000D695296|nr:TetR family transcriptional regulator [Nocardioides speluncae]
MTSTNLPKATQPSQDRSLARREALLRAAIELLAEGGARAVTHRAVAARAKVPLAATTYYFESIGKLTEEALRLHMTERVEELHELAAGATAGQSVTEIAERFIEALIDRESAAVVAQFEVFLEAARNPALRDVVAYSLEASEKLAEEILAALGARRPAQAATALVAMVNGFALNRLGRPLPVAEDAAAMLDAMRSLFIAQIMEDDELALWHSRLARPLAQEPSAS